MATSIIPNDYRVHVGFELITDIANSPENTYYMFLGNHMPVPGGVIGSASDDTNDTMISAYRNMICAKKIIAADASMMIRNIPWAANTAYAMYDDLDTNQESDNYFAIVNAGSFSHIWKCLDNNMGANSTAVPDISQIDASDVSYRTSDGYLWKYMASSSASAITQFGTDAYFPVTANAQVTSSAISGAIDVIAIANTGSGYRNWLLGTFAAADIRANGNNLTYAVTGNSVSSPVAGFYTGCNIYISGGSGIGQFKTVTDYFSNANGNFVIIDSAFNVPPQNGSTYQIYPGVVLKGDGRQTINAAARALINAIGNTVSRVDMLNRGAGYSYIAATVTANAVATPTIPAIIRGIYAPFNGHGHNVYEELGATRVSFSVTFANNEANTIPATNQYQQIGILKAPLFQNVVVNFTALKGTFLGNEQVYTYSTRLLQNNVVVSAGSKNISIANGILNGQVSSGDTVVFNASDLSAYWLSTVDNITSNNVMSITSAPPWACTTAQMSLAIIGTGQGLVTSLPGGNTVGISNVTGDFGSGTLAIGLNSGARGVIANVSRNDTVKGFDTFIALRKYIASSVSGTFQPNEILYMNPAGSNVATATSTAAIHTVIANSGTLTFLVSNNVGSFTEDVSAQIKGANSGAVATLTTKYVSEIAFGSSKVLYLENIAPATRSANTSDQINVILEF